MPIGYESLCLIPHSRAPRCSAGAYAHEHDTWRQMYRIHALGNLHLEARTEEEEEKYVAVSICGRSFLQVQLPAPHTQHTPHTPHTSHTLHSRSAP